MYAWSRSEKPPGRYDARRFGSDQRVIDVLDLVADRYPQAAILARIMLDGAERGVCVAKWLSDVVREGQLTEEDAMMAARQWEAANAMTITGHPDKGTAFLLYPLISPALLAKQNPRVKAWMDQMPVHSRPSGPAARRTAPQTSTPTG